MVLGLPERGNARILALFPPPQKLDCTKWKGRQKHSMGGPPPASGPWALMQEPVPISSYPTFLLRDVVCAAPRPYRDRPPVMLDPIRLARRCRYQSSVPVCGPSASIIFPSWAPRAAACVSCSRRRDRHVLITKQVFPIRSSGFSSSTVSGCNLFCLDVFTVLGLYGYSYLELPCSSYHLLVMAPTSIRRKKTTLAQWMVA